MKRKQNDSDFLKFLQNMPIPQVKNSEFKKSLESLFVSKTQNKIRRPGFFQIRSLKYIIPLAAMLTAALIFILLIPVLAPRFEITVVAVRNPVYLVEKQSGKRIQVTNEMKITEGTTVQTGGSGKALLSFEDSASFVLDELSSIDFLQAARQPEHENYMIQLQKGTVECRINFKRKESVFNIATEYTLISIQGTHFIVSLEPEKSIQVDLLEGTITLDYFYSLRSSMEELKLKAPALFTRISAILDGHIQLLNNKTLIKRNMKDIAHLNQVIKKSLSRIMQTESEKEIDRLIEEIKRTADSFAVIDKHKEKLPATEKPTHSESSADDTTEEETFDREISAITSLDEKKDHDTSSLPKKIVVINANGSVEEGSFSPTAWQKSEHSPAFNWTDTVSRTGKHSLLISSPHGEKKAIGWIYTLNKNIPYDKCIYVKVFIKTVALSGQGASVVLRADDTEQPGADAEIYTTTQGRRNITGTAEWKQYTLVLPEPIHDEIKSITLYLIMLPETKGDVYFDDISLYYED
jgi:hypothetical protein